MSNPAPGERNQSALQKEIEELGPWFHNLHLPDGTMTAPKHFLGDYPNFKWAEIAPSIPEDLTGWTALDIGCNAGFYSMELAKRGATVVGHEPDLLYLKQAQWAAKQFGFEDRVTFEQSSVYDLADVFERFDIVLFLGVLYHLRYPLLALDIVSRKVRRMMVFQSMSMPGLEVIETPEDLGLNDREQMREPGWPKMAFIENRLNTDPTNWWAPNHACIEAMLRSSGMQVIDRPTEEVYLCRPQDADQRRELWANRQEFRAAVGHRGRKRGVTSDFGGPKERGLERD